MKTNSFTRRIQALLVASGLVVVGTAIANEVNISGKSGVALSGYDPVAFFTDGKPVNGDPGITAEHEGATYFFASKEHRKMFTADPDKYAPQFGGYCTYGVSVGALFPVDITTWQVRNDKLYLNLNPAILEIFNKGFDKNVANATEKWPGLSK